MFWDIIKNNAWNFLLQITKISYAILKFYLIFQVSVFCFFKFFNRRSLSHTIHGIFLHMKLRLVLQFFLIIDKNAPVFYRWKICLHIRFFPAKFFFFFYRHICSVIPWGNACEAAEIIDYIKSSAPVSSFKTALACNIFCKSSARFRAAIWTFKKTSKPNHSVWFQFEGSGHSLFQVHAPVSYTHLTLPTILRV